jgi:dTDP-4-dehydrorhamnose 3,5-epimerase
LILTETELAGAYLVELERHEDERGFFARAFCEHEFAARGLATRYPQCNLSYNRRAHTLRGMHYQAAPHAEAKLVRCVAGAVHDVIVDLRAASPTRLRWIGVRLDARARTALYVPPGFAHGFLTLAADSEVFYMMGEFHEPAAARGLRWNDPGIGVAWPFEPAVISERDRGYPDFEAARFDG